MRSSGKTLKIIGALIVVFLVSGFLFLIVFLPPIEEYKSQVSAISFVSIDIGDVQDGTYTGECDAQVIYAKVEVIVRGGRVINISLLEHRNGRALPAEEITDRIVAEQTVDVDAVIKKAVENALAFGIQ